MSRMRELPIRDLIGKSVTAHGALAFDRRDSGIGPRRLESTTAWAGGWMSRRTGWSVLANAASAWRAS